MSILTQFSLSSTEFCVLAVTAFLNSMMSFSIFNSCLRHTRLQITPSSNVIFSKVLSNADTSVPLLLLIWEKFLPSVTSFCFWQITHRSFPNLDFNLFVTFPVSVLTVLLAKDKNQHLYGVSYTTRWTSRPLWCFLHCYVDFYTSMAFPTLLGELLHPYGISYTARCTSTPLWRFLHC